jgi:hypothetical protein
MGNTAWFCTREDIRSALDAASAARSDAQLDRALDAAARAVTSRCNRTFVPVSGTRWFDWPSSQTPRSWVLRLDDNDLISATAITSGDTTVPVDEVFLEPVNSCPPFTRVETRLDRGAAWQAGDTHQRAVSITGLWGYSNDQVPAGVLATGVDAAATAVTVSDSAAAGVGHLLTVGAERMRVTGKRLTSTGQTLQAPLTAKNNEQLLVVTDGSAFHEGETITLDAERMTIRDIAGNTLIVDRSADGSTLAAHTGSTIYAPRLLTVVRGVNGTTAATATGGTALTRWAPPGLIHQLAVAEAQNWLLQEQAGYLRTSGASSGSSGKEATLDGLKDLREQVDQSVYARKIRTRAV